MSHFSHMKTRFRNLFYLEKALNKLNIRYIQENNNDSEFDQVNLIISQSTGSDVKFIWDSQAYKLVVDMNFWKQDRTVDSFIDQITQQYASEAINYQGQKIGFKPITPASETYSNLTKKIFLQRWGG